MIDVNGNIDSCFADITVLDTIAPAAVCTDLSVTLDANGQATINSEDLDGGSSDNCGIASIVASQTSFDCNDVPSVTVTLTVTDASGNSSTCTANVDVTDDIAPTAVCANISVTLDATGNVAINAEDLDGGSTDNCGIVSIVASETAFDCSDLGTNTVTLTVTDAAGNSSTCSAVVTVVDNTNPAIVCPANITVGTSAPNCSAAVNYNVTATDNCWRAGRP